jgi:uncharacterized membrane protein
MRLIDRFRQGELRLSRIEAFSDGVFAIVVTLLVLDLKVPTLKNHASAAEMAHELVELLPKFLSWFISFLIVCKFWLNHHHLLEFARHANYAMVWLNSLFLLTQSFIPFPTAVIGEYPENPAGLTLFGAVMAINTVVFIVLQTYILRHLVKPELAGTTDPNLLAKSMVGPTFYLLGAAAAWVSCYLAFALFLFTPLFFITPLRQPSSAGHRAG